MPEVGKSFTSQKSGVTGTVVGVFPNPKGDTFRVKLELIEDGVAEIKWTTWSK